MGKDYPEIPFSYFVVAETLPTMLPEHWNQRLFFPSSLPKTLKKALFLIRRRHVLANSLMLVAIEAERVYHGNRVSAPCSRHQLKGEAS